ncbi:hypothetical protein [Methylomonas koyamae]|uniref:hypothetical protein n=1 Tax=Methylomonas koyamae TaxID=702114 RepID=UPI00278BE5D0|nr:hypothetical protein [Methylomonas koyamae]
MPARRGIVELDKAAKLLLTELRAGTIGRITLETPDMIAAEMAELAEIRAEKTAEREARRPRS